MRHGNWKLAITIAAAVLTAAVAGRADGSGAPPGDPGAPAGGRLTFDEVVDRLGALEARVAALEAGLDGGPHAAPDDPPEPTPVAPAPGGAGPAPTLDINSTEGIARLTDVSGIGPVLAGRIAEALPVGRMADLLEVEGVGPARLGALIDAGYYAEGDLQPTPAPTPDPDEGDRGSGGGGLRVRPAEPPDPVGGGPAPAEARPAAPELPALHPEDRAIHVAADPEVGDDSADGSADAPLRTIGEAAGRLRDGHGDHVLLRRGDVFGSRRGARDLGGYFSLSGRSAEHPIVFGWYDEHEGEPGTGACTTCPMPTVELLADTGAGHDAHWLRMNGSSFIHISGVRFYSPRHNPDSGRFDARWAYHNHARPIRAQSDAHRVTVDGCAFDFTSALYAQGGSSNLTVRNSTAYGGYQGPAHAQAIYAHSSVDTLVIEDNVIDRTGYNLAAAEALERLADPDYEPRRFRPTHHNQGLYIQASDATVRGNLIARTSSAAIHFRDGGHGLIEDNLLLANGNGWFTSTDSVVRGNVMTVAGLHLVPDGFSVGAGPNTMGYSAHDTASTVERNVIAHVNPAFGSGFRRMSNAMTAGNVLYDRAGEYDPPPDQLPGADPERTIERYVAEVLGLGEFDTAGAVDVFMREARAGRIDVADALSYVREGFGVDGGDTHR